MINKKIGIKSPKNQSKINTQSMTTDFGERKIVGQNFSKMVSIPKAALANLGSRSHTVKVELVQEKGERFLKITPKKTGGKTS
jgi:hypothetical protein